MTKEIEIEKQIVPIAEEAISVKIVDEKSMAKAVGLLSKLNQINDAIQEEKEKVTKPLNAALKAERARWKPLEDKYEKSILELRSEISRYRTAQARIVKDKEAAIAARVGEGKGKIKVETAIRKFDEIERPESKVITASGLVRFRTDKVLKITDRSKIPAKYLVVDEKKLLEDLKAGAVVSGAEIEEIQTPINVR